MYKKTIKVLDEIRNEEDMMRSFIPKDGTFEAMRETREMKDTALNGAGSREELKSIKSTIEEMPFQKKDVDLFREQAKEKLLKTLELDKKQTVYSEARCPKGLC